MYSRIDTESDAVTTFGRVSEEKNKYQGGTLAADGFIYAIPSNSNNILCIDSNKRVKNEAHDGDRNAAFTIGDIRCTKNKIKDKWQGKLSRSWRMGRKLSFLLTLFIRYVRRIRRKRWCHLLHPGKS